MVITIVIPMVIEKIIVKVIKVQNIYDIVIFYQNLTLLSKQ